MLKNLRSFFRNIIRDSKFELRNQLSRKFKDFCGDSIDFGDKNSENLIHLAVLFEKFLFERVFQASKSDFYKNLISEDEFHSKLTHQSLRKDFLNSFKAKGYFQKQTDFAHLRREFSSALKNYDFENFEGFRQGEILNANIQACLICHERGKDSCRKGFVKNEKKEDGCPLKMHISEAIFLKKQGFHLASLLMMMINNPLCILTGHRICVDCNKGCIFSASGLEPVDVSGVESKILFDVLEKIDFGPEIYYFFLIFNPLYDFINNDDQEGHLKRKILVVGAGAAGLSASYNLLIRKNQIVKLIDAGRIDFDHERLGRFLKHPLKNGAKFLNFNQSRRKKNLGFSGFGGVMEYGITNRWNKNLLDLLLIFFKRFEKSRNFQMSDAIFFSDYSGFGLRTAFSQENFDLVLFATGASKQNLPSKIEFSFLGRKPKNLFFAADFLIDYNLKNAKNLRAFFEVMNHQDPEVFSAIILGFGLTAVDTASVFFQNFKGKIGMIYSGELKKSSAWKGNHEEVLRLFSLIPENYLEVFENHEISKVEEILVNSQSLYKISFKNHQKEILTERVFVATGFSQNEVLFEENNLDYEKILRFLCASKENIFFPYSDKKFIGFIGDAHPLFRGSVVKAIESGQKASLNLLKECDSHQGILKKKPQKPKIKSLKFYESLGLTHLIINLPLNQDSVFPGQFFRVWLGWPEAPIHLTPIFLRQNEIHFLIKKQVKLNNDKFDVSILGPLGKSFAPLDCNIFFIGSKFALYSKILLFQSFRERSIPFFICFVGSFNKAGSIKFFEQKLKDFKIYDSDEIKSVMSKLSGGKINFIFEDVDEGFKSEILGFFQGHASCFSNLSSKLGCSMKGLCGKCFSFDEKTNSVSFDCRKSQIYEID